MTESLLIHSLAEFATVTLPALDLAQARNVCEIGAEHGGNSAVLVRWLEGRGGLLTSIDPAPSAAFGQWLAEHVSHVRHVKRTSLEAIPTLDPQDAWFIDGDHNWYTVYHELKAIHEVHWASAKPLLIFLHDAGWPWARRDLYYAPERVPAGFRHPHSWGHGVTLDNAHAIQGGFRGGGAFAVALEEGGPRNGVLTAIEDFFGDHAQEMFWAFVPGVFGLGVLFSRDHPAAQGLANLFAPLHENALLKRLERNRLANYLRVIELQDGAPDSAPPEHSITENLVGVMADQWDHPEVWTMIEAAAETERELTLEPLVAYWRQTLKVQQAPLVAKLITILEAVGSAHLGEVPGALRRLEDRSVADSQCALVAGALFHVRGLSEPENPRYQLVGKVCMTPFLQADVLENSTHLCCASWLRLSAGNMREKPWREVWNSPEAQAIRASMLDGSYRYCNKTLCPSIQGNALALKEELRTRSEFWCEVVDENRTELEQGPESVNLAYDRTCNLSCPSCRNERYAADESTRKVFDVLQDRNILPMLQTAKTAFVTGSGDPFASKNFRRLLQSINARDFPNLKLQIMTNGMLLTPEEWKKFPSLAGRVWRIKVSIDAATGPTHEMLRRGAVWETMLENMAFIGELRARGEVESFELVFVVQRENFREMGDAVDLALRVGADQVYFARISNWGTFSAHEFREKLVFVESHPEHAAFLAAMADPRLRDPRVLMPDLECFLPTTAVVTARAAEEPVSA